jgi:DNA-binding transcriptional ArsR family regulator
MDVSQSLTAFAALSQPLRLEAFRLLIKAGPDGMAAGDIAVALDAKPNTTSQNLSQLVQAGLITSTRAGRSIIYRSNMEGLNALLRFMLEDCCGGTTEACAPVINMIAPCCGVTSKKHV